MSSESGWPAALTSGAVLWIVATMAAGNREPWDFSTYWVVFLPLALLLSLTLGAIFTERPWRWPIGVMLMQLPVMILMTGSGLGMLPFGIILLLVLALPGMLAAWLGASLRKGMAK